MLFVRALITRLLRLGSYLEELEVLGTLAQAGLHRPTDGSSSRS